jgi:hypothetical protein
MKNEINKLEEIVTRLDMEKKVFQFHTAFRELYEKEIDRAMASMKDRLLRDTKVTLNTLITCQEDSVNALLKINLPTEQSIIERYNERINDNATF